MNENMFMVFYLRIRCGGGDEFQKSDSRGDGVDNVTVLFTTGTVCMLMRTLLYKPNNGLT